jgi:NADPH:quinone reductase-like Zn-dependent oxidoreductase
MAAAIRAAVPDGVDALLDAAVLGRTALPAIRDGGQIAVVRGFAGEPGRGIRVRAVHVWDYATNGTALGGLGRLAAAGRLTLRVAATFPPEEAAAAHRRLEAGGVRGRLVLVF